jgi:hypothetical protein
MGQVEVKCPSCGKKGKIKISDDLIKSTSKGLLSVNIANDIICPHSFLAYIDKNLQIRDYFFVDFKVTLPEISLIADIEDEIITSKDVIDIDLIKLNLSALTLTYIIKSIFLKQKIVLIIDQEFLENHIKNFFKYIIQNSFEMDLTLIRSYNNKKNYNDAMIFDPHKIIRNNKNLINPKKLDIEKKIIERFFTENKLEYSYIVLKNEIYKAFTLSKLIKEYIEEEIKEGRQANILKIQNKLESNFKTKIDNLYLKFLIDIVINYFEFSVPSIIAGFFEFL